MQTELGNIASLLQEVKQEQTPLQDRLDNQIQEQMSTVVLHTYTAMDDP